MIDLSRDAAPPYPFSLRSQSQQAGWGLRAWYPMSISRLAGPIYDPVNGFTASVTGTLTEIFDPLGGRGLSFSGAAAKIVLPKANLSFAGLSAGTLSVWYRPSAHPASNAGLVYESTTTSGYSRFALFHLSDGKIMGNMRDTATGSPFSATTSSAITPGLMYKIDVTFDADTDLLILYLNGVESARNTSSKGPFTTGAPADDLAIGAFTGAIPAYIKGAIFDVRLRSQYLSESAILHEYVESTRWDLYSPVLSRKERMRRQSALWRP